MSLIYEALRSESSGDHGVAKHHAIHWKTGRASLSHSSPVVVINRNMLLGYGLLVGLAMIGGVIFLANTLGAKSASTMPVLVDKANLLVTANTAPVIQNLPSKPVEKSAAQPEAAWSPVINPPLPAVVAGVPKFQPEAQSKPIQVVAKAKVEPTLIANAKATPAPQAIGPVTKTIEVAPVASLAPVTKPEVIVQAVASNEQLNLADVFDALNRELGKPDKSEAQSHLKKIQSALPSNSMARMRAEAWYEYHLGRFESARSIYQRILARAPGDEQATAVLQAMAQNNSASATAK